MAEPFYEAMTIQHGSAGVSVALDNARHFGPGGRFEGQTLEILPYAADLIVSMAARATRKEITSLHIPDIQTLESFSDDGHGQATGQEITQNHIDRLIEAYNPKPSRRITGLLSSWKGLNMLRKLNDVSNEELDDFIKTRAKSTIQRRIRGAGHYLVTYTQDKNLSNSISIQNTNKVST
jgi:hypothetical protein